MIYDEKVFKNMSLQPLKEKEVELLADLKWSIHQFNNRNHTKYDIEEYSHRIQTNVVCLEKLRVYIIENYPREM